MLRSVDKLKGYKIQAVDGEIGKVGDLFYDDRQWRVRYLVLDLGNWLFGRQVLIAPTAVSDINAEAGEVFLSLTKDRIENSPEIAADEPVSREKERALHEYYQWQPYWTSMTDDPLAFGAYPTALNSAFIAEKTKKKEPKRPDSQPEPQSHLRSAEEVNGYSIRASDGGIGRVVDFLFDEEEWVIRQLVVDTGSWLPGRKVLVAPPWIARIHWAEKTVHVRLTKESIRHSPPFDPDLLDMEKYEKELLQHYKTWFSFLLNEDKEQGETNMFLGKDIMGNAVISVDDGRSIGKVKDVYITTDCQKVAGIYLGTEGLFSRQSFLVTRDDLVTIGEDAVLVKHADVVQEEKDIPEAEEAWLRRDELQGRPVDTPNGTKVGKVGDVVLNKEGNILGFSLSQVYVSGPVADNHSVAIHTVQDVGDEDGVMTIDLERAEVQELSVA